MSDEKYNIIPDPVYGYKRLEPVPENEELSEFYQSKYYDLISQGGRAPELQRLMAGGEKAEHERRWLRETLYTDICSVLGQHSTGKRILDVGCGTGEFLLYMKENGFETFGIEPSSDAVAAAKSQGLTVSCSTLNRFVEHNKSRDIRPFDAISFLNVLEHVPDPVPILESTKSILNKDGIICVRVPNDFTEIQLASQKKLNKEPWWIAVPDHINYFNFQNLQALLENIGFEVIYSQGDFPMEMFLLMGDDYTDNNVIGNSCHQKRISFEMSIPDELRRQLYSALAGIGMGRDSLVFARIK